MPQTDSNLQATDIPPPGVIITGDTASVKCYSLTASAAYKALTDLAPAGRNVNRFYSLKANLGKVYFRWCTAGSGQDAAVNGDNSWYLFDGEEKPYFVPSGVTHICIIAADTTPKLFVTLASNISNEVK